MLNIGIDIEYSKVKKITKCTVLFKYMNNYLKFK